MSTKEEKYELQKKNAQKLSFLRRERSLPAVLGESFIIGQKNVNSRTNISKQNQIEMKSSFPQKNYSNSELEIKEWMKSSIGVPQSALLTDSKKLNPRVQQNSSNSSQKFAKICGEFSKFGPARSVGAITAKTLFRNSNNEAEKNKMRKSQVQTNVKNALSQCKNVSRKFKTLEQLQNLEEEKKPEVNKFIYNLSVINTIRIVSPTKKLNTFFNQSTISQNRCPSDIRPTTTLNSFTKIFHRGGESRPCSPTKNDKMEQKIKSGTSLNIDLLAPMLMSNNIQFKEEMFNLWVDKINETKEIRRVRLRTAKNTKQNSIQKQFNPLVDQSPFHRVSTSQPVILTNKQIGNFLQQQNFNLVQKYIAQQRAKLYKMNSDDNHKIIEQTEQEEKKLLKKQEDKINEIQSSSQLNSSYEQMVKRRRILKRLRFFLISAKRQHKKGPDLIEFVKSHSTEWFQKTRTYTFLKLFKSERYGDCDELLSTQPHIVDDFNWIGEVPLHVSVRRNNIQMVQYLMTKGPDLETKNFYGFTPLSLAMDLKHYDVALLLILYSANPWSCKSRHRIIKIAQLSYIKLKCPLIYKQPTETLLKYKQRVFEELQFFLLTPKGQTFPVSDIYFNQFIEQSNI